MRKDIGVPKDLIYQIFLKIYLGFKSLFWGEE